jgi:hypothetical protein
MCRRERYYIETLKASLNIKIPTHTKKEYRIKNKEKIQSKFKEYRIKNKEKIDTLNHEYYQKNNELLKQKTREYREKNKALIKEKRTQKIKCECGAEFQKITKCRHIKTKRHLEYLKTLEN